MGSDAAWSLRSIETMGCTACGFFPTAGSAGTHRLLWTATGFLAVCADHSSNATRAACLVSCNPKPRDERQLTFVETHCCMKCFPTASETSDHTAHLLVALVPPSPRFRPVVGVSKGVAGEVAHWATRWAAAAHAAGGGQVQSLETDVEDAGCYIHCVGSPHACRRGTSACRHHHFEGERFFPSECCDLLRPLQPRRRLSCRPDEKVCAGLEE